MARYTFGIKKNKYYNIWYPEMLDNGVCVKRDACKSREEAEKIIKRWKEIMTPQERDI